ncbi:1-phosphofructokinase family hexose kinase [Sphingomonas sp. MMS12-HWE2-04]|uniref:1-phosphofructokinase family hexose kinase n=1 Tax=Sphingomonas sp. MMS12-HWE2-04 TaxID=3234199 RepID=UPI00384DCB0D
MPAIVTLTLNPALDITTETETVRPTHKLRCGPAVLEPGGGGINVARVLHALGGDAVAIFPQGGPAGATMEQLLRDSGVPIAPVSTAGATRESFTVDETGTGKQFRFVLPGPELSEDELARLLAAIEAVAAPACLVASGSLPPGLDPAIFGRLATLCKRIGARLVIDTSGPALAACEGIQAYLIKPSIREVEELVGRDLRDDGAQAEAARELIARGFAEVVVISLGERGALLAGKGIDLRMAALPVPPGGGAVGAGDSMVAGLTLALARGASLEEALRMGVAAGAAALMTPAEELVRRDDVERLYAAASAGTAAEQNSP